MKFDPLCTGLAGGVALAAVVVALIFRAPAFYGVGAFFAACLLFLAWHIAHAPELPWHD